MIKEVVYYETADGKRFKNYNDARKYEKENNDPLAKLINEIFAQYPPELTLKISDITDIINANKDRFIQVLMTDKIEQSQNLKVDSILNRLFDERNLPNHKIKGYRIKVEK
jgi:hypothetical protein